MRFHAALSLAVAIGLAGAATAAAQRRFDDVEIRTQKLAEGIHMLVGAGGNVGVCEGPDGVFLVDDQFANLTEKIRAAIARLNERPIRFVLNTHWHGDHVGGNENMAKAGAVIVAHDNVRLRMSTEQFRAHLGRTTPPAPPRALPVVTFNDSVTFHFNGETVTCTHVAPAHTDGDVIVWFRRADVVHVGDCLFNGMYPVIDISAGGSIGGMIAAADRLLAEVGTETKIIPGHGPLATRADLQAFRDMLATTRDRIGKLIAQKKTLEEVKQAKPLADLDPKWGSGPRDADSFIEVVYLDLTR